MTTKPLDQILAALARSEVRIEILSAYPDAPQQIVDNENRSIKRYNEEIEKYIQIFKTDREEFEKYKDEIFYVEFMDKEEFLRKEISSPFCPSCRFMYETIDGKAKFSGNENIEEIAEKSDCSIYPNLEEPPSKCDYFDDSGHAVWEKHYGSMGKHLDILKKRKSELAKKRPDLVDKYKKKISLNDNRSD
jgi:hypothetical protein